MDKTSMPQLSNAKIVLIVFAIALSTLFNNGDTVMLSTATPTILADIGGTQFFSLTFTAKTLTAAIGYLIVGKLADKFGRRNMMCIGAVLVCVGYILSALSRNILMLIISRAVSGIGAGFTLSLGYIILGDLLKGKIYARAYIVMTIACGLASVAGGPLGGVFCTYGNWTTIFWILAALPLITSAIFMSCCPNYIVDSSSVKFDTLGCILFTIATTLLIIVLSISGTFANFTDPSMITCLVCSLVVYYIFFRHENRIDEQSCIFPVKLITQRRYAMTCIGQFCMTFNSMILLSYLPYFLQQDKGLSAIQSGYAVSVQQAISVIGCVVFVRALGKSGKYRFWTRFCVIGECAAILLLLVVTGLSDSLVLLLAMCVLYGMFASVESSVFIMGAQQGIGEDKIAVATAGVTFMQSFSCVVGAAIGGLCINVFGSFLSAFVAAEIVTAVAMILILIFYPNDKQNSEH